jgi:hypothetical protein
MPLHRLRPSWHPRDSMRTAATLRGEVRALEQLIGARSCDIVIVTGLMNPHGAIAARRAGVPSSGRSSTPEPRPSRARRQWPW